MGGRCYSDRLCFDRLCSDRRYSDRLCSDRCYSDRLCSDRCYSDSPQSRRPSTSLAPLGICVEIVEIGKTLEGVEMLHASKARHWSRHQGNLSPMHIGSGFSNFRTKILKCQTKYGAQIAPWFSGFGSASFQSVLPVGLFNCSQQPDVPTVKCRNSVCRNRVCRNSVVYPSHIYPRMVSVTIRGRWALGICSSMDMGWL